MMESTLGNRVQERIAGKQEASVVAELVDWESRSQEWKEAFLKAIDDLPKPEPVSESPQTLAQLESMEIPFGKYAGRKFCDVPLSYLQWLCAEQESFYRSMRAYLKHPDVWREQETHEH